MYGRRVGEQTDAVEDLTGKEPSQRARTTGGVRTGPRRSSVRSDHVRANPMVERMALAPQVMEAPVIVRVRGAVALGLELAKPRLHCALLESVRHVVVDVGVDFERVADCGNQ